MRVFKFDVIDSTNNFLKEKLDLIDGDLAITKTQTKGRGRRGNTWYSSEGAAAFSFALASDKSIPESDYCKLPILVGFSLLKSLKTITNLDFKFKWTNDIYLDGKKISGILIERVGNFFIIGIGININNTLKEEVKNKSITLFDKTGIKYDVENLILKSVKDFYELFYKFKNGNWNEMLNEINSFNYLFGKKIEILIGDKSHSGIAGNILEDGMLEVFVGGEIKKFNIGEIHIPKIEN